VLHEVGAEVARPGRVGPRHPVVPRDAAPALQRRTQHGVPQRGRDVHDRAELVHLVGREPFRVDAVQAVRVGGQIKEPKKVHNVSPSYPDIAKQARVQGIVILECIISPQGKVSDVKVLRGIPLLDQAAIDAVKQWVYTPTLLNGVPVPVIMTVTVNFKLS